MATKRGYLIPVLLAVASLAGLGRPVYARQGGVQIAVGDQLMITVSGNTELTRKVTVDVDGTFEYPYLLRVKAAGLTTSGLRDYLKKRLDPDYAVNPTVTVELTESVSKHFSIIGEVRAPGNYPFTGAKFLLDALAQAGSVTESASDAALLIHAGQSADLPGAASQGAVTLDLFDLLNGTSLKNNVQLQDGDTINILKAKPVYITGYVKSVGAYPVRRGMTVSEALTLAGGVSDKGKTSGIKIEREGPNGKKIPISVKDNTKEIVKPGDTIIVPARIW